MADTEKTFEFEPWLAAKAAWLAGLLDGEGSIGIAIERKPSRVARPFYLKASIQMSITEQSAVKEASRVCKLLGVRGVSYSYQERDPMRHRDAFYFRVGRLLDINILSNVMMEHAVVKRKHWRLMAAYTASRLRGAEIEETTGRVTRGGKPKRAYSKSEIEIARKLRKLNLRGPAAIERDKEWEHKLENVASE